MSGCEVLACAHGRAAAPQERARIALTAPGPTLSRRSAMELGAASAPGGPGPPCFTRAARGGRTCAA
eukprot:11565310-Alexandrium_andersonii.AAC.1